MQNVLWNALTDVDQTTETFHRDEIQVFFKHSPRCGVSRSALKLTEQFVNGTDSTRFHLIDVLAQRPLSDHLAKLSGIRHESPQVVMVQNGNVLYSASHGQISPEKINSLLYE